MERIMLMELVVFVDVRQITLRAPSSRLFCRRVCVIDGPKSATNA